MSFETKMDEVPRFYVKYLENEMRMSAKPLKGYVLHPQFVKSEAIRHGSKTRRTPAMPSVRALKPIGPTTPCTLHVVRANGRTRPD